VGWPSFAVNVWTALSFTEAPQERDAADASPPEPTSETEDALRRQVRVRRPSHEDAQRELDRTQPGFARVLEVRVDEGATPADALGRVLARSPGVYVRSLGGLGQFSAVQIRGSAAQQVQLFLEGVPLNSSFAGLVDVSSEPLDGLSRVEIYRGYVPIGFGGATLGGAINLRSVAATTPTTTWSASMGAGSFGTREARVAMRVGLGARPWALGVSASYGGSEGDFLYFNDGGTPRIETDDRDLARENNDYDRVSAQVTMHGRPRNLEVAQVLRGNWRGYGIPASGAIAESQARQQEFVVRSVTRIRFERRAPRHPEFTWILGLAAGGRRYRDPLGQVGVGTDDETSVSFDAYVSPRMSIPLWRGANLGLVADARAEFVSVDESPPTNSPVDPLTTGDANRSRLSTGVGFELDQRLFRDVWQLVPAVRIDAYASRFRVPPGEGEISDAGRDERRFAASPRFGTRIALVEGAQLRGSAGRYFRAPTLFELFGDRGFVVGNEGLRPERGWTVDGGAVYDLVQRSWSLYAQIAGFATWSEDLIQFVRSGPVVRPVNVSSARVRGLESALRVTVLQRIVEIDANYTLLDSRNGSPEAEQSGQPLPGRPRHDARLRLGGGYPFPIARSFEPRIAYELEFIGETSLDLSHRYRVGPRLLHSLVFEARFLGLHVGVEVRNLADLRRTEIVPAAGPPDPIPAPISDFIGYPLPGRSVFARVTIDANLLASSR